ncbi:MAG: hypothetical protein KF891_03145 [Rhizobacter sp.]|nr:hypothetical protein [Rhizobacter sp.]
MPSHRFCLTLLIASGTLLAGCASLPPPDPAAELPHCYKTNKGRVISCTRGPVPSLNADTEAKRFAPDPQALTVYIVRRNWGDSRHFVKVRADGGIAVETLPDTMVRMKLKPGRHTIAFEFEGLSQTTTIDGKAGDVRFLRINGMAWSWKSTFDWAAEPEAAIRERALRTRLVADVAAR